MICDWWILCVSVFQGSLLVIVIMIAKNAIVKAAFELQNSHVCEKRGNKRFQDKNAYLAFCL